MRHLDLTKEKLGLLTLILVGLLARLAVATRSPLMGDEVGTWLYIQRDFTYILTHFAHPWLTMGPFIAAMRAWSFVVGLDNPFLLRLPAVVAGTLAIPCIAGVARRMGGGTRVVLTAALFTALNPYLIRFAATFRSYSVVHAAAPAALYFLLCWLQTPRARYGWGCAFFTTLCVAAHFATAYYCGFLAALYVWNWVAVRHRWNVWAALRTSISLWGPMLAFAFLGAALLWPYLESIAEFRSALTSEAPTPVNYLSFMFAQFFIGGWWTVPTLFLLIAGWIHAVRHHPLRSVIVGLGTAVPILLYSWSGTQHYPWGATRFLSYVLPLLIIQLAFSAHDLTNRRAGAVFLTALVLFTWAPSLQNMRHRSPWFDLQQWAARTMGPHGSILAFGNDGLILYPTFPGQQWKMVDADAYMRDADNPEIPIGDLLVVLPAPPGEGIPWTRFGGMYGAVYSGADRREIAVTVLEDLTEIFDEHGPHVKASHFHTAIRLMKLLDRPCEEQLKILRRYYTMNSGQ